MVVRKIIRPTRLLSIITLLLMLTTQKMIVVIVDGRHYQTGNDRAIAMSDLVIDVGCVANKTTYRHFWKSYLILLR